MLIFAKDFDSLIELVHEDNVKYFISISGLFKTEYRYLPSLRPCWDKWKCKVSTKAT